jgi:peptide deformylase
MAIYPIRTFGDPVLRTVAAPVAAIDDRLRRLADDMLETMYDAPGVGLAAPQIGVSKRVFVFDAGEGPHVVVNPEPVTVAPGDRLRTRPEGSEVVVPDDADDEWLFDEGCLSVPGHYWPIARPSFFAVRGTDLDGTEVIHAGDELVGRVLQHELDHLDGTLLLQRLPKRARRKALRDLRNEAIGLG